MDMGYTSMFYDQPFEFYPDYGYVDKGRRPETTHQAALDIAASVRKQLLARNANAVIIGEECDIFATPVIDLLPAPKRRPASWGLSPDGLLADASDWYPTQPRVYRWPP